MVTEVFNAALPLPSPLEIDEEKPTESLRGFAVKFKFSDGFKNCNVVVMTETFRGPDIPEMLGL